jgi:hypothetical protein
VNTNQTLEQLRIVAQAHIVTRSRAELRHAEQGCRAAWKELKAEQWRWRGHWGRPAGSAAVQHRVLELGYHCWHHEAKRCGGAYTQTHTQLNRLARAA